MREWWDDTWREKEITKQKKKINVSRKEESKHAIVTTIVCSKYCSNSLLIMNLLMYAVYLSVMLFVNNLIMDSTCVP